MKNTALKHIIRWSLLLVGLVGFYFAVFNKGTFFIGSVVFLITTWFFLIFEKYNNKEVDFNVERYKYLGLGLGYENNKSTYVFYLTIPVFVISITFEKSVKPNKNEYHGHDNFI